MRAAGTNSYSTTSTYLVEKTSVFLETLLEFGLNRLVDLTTAVQKKTRT